MPAYTVIDVYVNVLPGAAVTKEQIKKALKSANKTLKKAGAKIRFGWKSKHTRFRARVGHTNDDADAGPDERGPYRRRGKKELKKRFKGRGVKLWFCNNMLVRDNGRLVAKGAGLSFHKDPNAFISLKAHITGDPPNQTLDTEEMGRTIAHELCHILTIKDHSDEPDNLMNESGSGSKLDRAQLDEIKKGAALRARTTKSKDAPNQTPKKQKTKYGCWVDENEPPSQNFLAAVYLYQPGEDLPWNGVIQLVGLIDHTKPVELSFKMHIMVGRSADDASGSSDRRWRIDIALRSDGGGLPLPSGRVTDLASGDSAPLDEVALQRHESILDEFEEGEAEFAPAFDEISFVAGPDKFGDLPEGSSAELVASEAFPGSRVKAHLPIDGEVEDGAETTVVLDNYLVAPGDTVVCRGEGFTAESPLEVYADDELVGSAQATEAGDYAVEFAAPAEPGFYWIWGRDACGLTDFTILDVGR